MADTKISALTAVVTPATTDEFAVNQGGASKKLTLGQVKSFVIDPTVAGSVQIVAATDSSAKDKAGADYTCDGTADDVQIQAAIDAMPTLGGVVILRAGTYTIAATPTITANKRIMIWGYGAKINLAASTGGLKVNQGISNARGVAVYGVRIDGQSNASTVGVEFEDTNNSSLIDVEIENCATGWLLDSQAASNYVEGSLALNCLWRGNTKSIHFSTTSGTGSFMQTRVINGKIVVGGGSSGIGIDVDNLAIMNRVRIEANLWIGTDETAVDLDGNMEDADLDIAVEGEGGSTGNTALVIGTNCSNIAQAWIKFKLTGTINTQITNTGAEDFVYQPRADLWVLTQGTTVLGIRRHGDSTDRLRFEGLTAGGKIQFGSGSALDVDLLRSAADVLLTNDKFDPASLNLQVKAGTPVDGDIVGGAASGDIVWDSTNAILYIRDGSTWKAIAWGSNPFSVGALLQGAPPSNGFRMVWRAPFACTVTNVRSHFDAGTSITVNARRNQTSDFLSADRTNSTANAWDDAGAVQNTAIAAGDDIEVELVATSGAVTKANIQVDLTRP